MTFIKTKVVLWNHLISKLFLETWIKIEHKEQ